MVIVSAIAELERNLIVERVKSGMRRAKLEGRRIGRPRQEVDVAALMEDRARGLSLSQLAKQYGIGQTTVRRLLNQPNSTAPKGVLQSPLQVIEGTQSF